MITYENKNSGLHVSRSFHGILAHCTSKKRHVSWEEADFKAGGLYSEYTHLIAHHFSTLTLMELKICALIKSLKVSSEISDILGVSEHTIENHRVNIRKKMGIQKGVNLSARMIGI